MTHSLPVPIQSQDTSVAKAPPPAKTRSLRAKATMLAIALSTLPVFATSSIAYLMASKAIVRQITNDQTLRAELASSQIDYFLTSRLRDLEALAVNPVLTDAALAATPAKKEQAIKDFREALEYFDSIVLFDTAGNPIGQATTDSRVEENYGDRGYFQAALKTGQSTMNGPGLSSSSGKLRVEFAVPVKDSQTGNTIALIRGRVPGSYIDTLFESLESAGDGWYLINEAGNLFAGSKKDHLSHPATEHMPGVGELLASKQAGSAIFPLHVEDDEDADHTEAHEEGAHHGEGAHEPHGDPAEGESGINFGREKELLTYVPVALSDELPDRNMGLLVFTDTQVSLAPQRQLAGVFALGTVIAALVSSAIATILAKRISDPIHTLTHTARNITQEGRFDLRVPVTSTDELGSLANSFNQMIEWVGLRTHDLEDSQLDLELRTQELGTIINSLGDGLLVTNAAGRIVRVNPPLLKMFNLSQDAILGQQVSKVFDTDVAKIVAQSTYESLENVGVEVDLAGGNIGQALASSITDNESNAYSGSVILIRDITAEKEVDRMKTDFISTVSHELRTPLTSVLGFAKIIQKKLETVLIPAIVSEEKKAKRAARQVTENLQIIISEGERLTSLINDVLDIAKIEAGKIEWRMVKIDPKTVVEQAIAATSVLAQKNNITFHRDIAPNLPIVTADQDRIIQVLINLISNAIKFTQDGTVTCEVKPTEDELRISIIDTGIGISKEDQLQVFEKFKQVGEIMTDKPQGTGLGLPICKQIVEHHGGRIWVESQLNVGSTFSIALPLSGVKPQAINHNPTVEDLVKRIKADVKQTAPSAAGDIKTILVVDDESNIRRLLRQELETEGYLVKEAKDGVAALESIKQNPPDLIITDVMMPRLDGFDLAGVLKTNPETANIPTVILSIVEDQDRGFRLGVDRYLTKPIDVTALLTNVETLLTHKTSRSKVLVVNKDASASKTLTEVLLTKGYVVAEASSGQEGLDKARAIKPDMMIVDAELSEEDNIVKTLRFEKGLENVSVILVESADHSEQMT